MAQDKQERCARMQLHDTAANAIGYSLKRMKLDTIDIGESIVVTEPRMAGLRGPSISLLGRDVRLAVTQFQTSPQELWHKGQWNKNRIETPCFYPSESWGRSLKRGFYGTYAIEHSMGITNYHPSILYRTRAIAEFLQVRPYGFTFGASMAAQIAGNTGFLLNLPPDPRPAVRRDMARFAHPGGVERLFASWHATPITDVHVGITGGYLEEMYAGAGAEIIYRPWGSPFWVGADGWSVWRRDPSFMNLQITGEQDFTGHVRAGYDIPHMRTSFYAAAGRYLAGDSGASVGLNYDLPNGARINAAMTWTNREEWQGFFKNTKFDPTIRVTWPLNQNRKASQREIRGALKQMGRDGGQMLDRPMPLEKMTESFSTREVMRAWPNLLDRTKKEAAYVGGL